jgi:RNA polymerase sigma-70 factor, ECF subfamily
MRSGGRTSDQGAWDWDHLSNACRRLARHYSAHCDAEDIAQEALVRAWRFRSSVRRGERLDAWLAVIVRNEAARHRTRLVPEPVPDVDRGLGVEDERLTAVAAAADVRSALGRLNADERMLLELRYTRDLTQPAIAKELALPEGTVKVRLHRARSKLRQALSQS